MTRFIATVSVLIGIIGSNMAFADGGEMHMKTNHHKMNMTDTRISLGLPAKMKQHQLANMRSHVAAIKSVVSLMAENKFDDASEIAHAKLGLNPEMKEMFNNGGFAIKKKGGADLIKLTLIHFRNL